MSTVFHHTATLVSSTAYVLMCGGIDLNKQIPMPAVNFISHETDLRKISYVLLPAYYVNTYKNNCSLLY